MELGFFKDDQNKHSMNFLGEVVGAFKKEEIVHLNNLLKIVENGGNNEFITTALVKSISQLLLKLNDKVAENEKTKSEQIKEIVGAVNFLKNRVDEAKDAVQYVISKSTQQIERKPLIELKDIESIGSKPTEQKESVKEEEIIKEKEENLEGYGIQEYTEEISTWVKKREYEVIYDSEKDGLSSYSLNSKICGKSNVMIFVETSDNQIFGSYNGKTLPTPQNEGEYCFVRDDEEFFLFKIGNNKIEKIRKRERTEKSNASILIHCSLEDVIYVSRAYCVKTKGSFVMPGISQEYEINDDKGDDYLTGTHDPNKFDVKKVFAVWWK